MNVFAVINLSPATPLDEQITARFPNDSMKVSDTVTLVAGPATSKEVSDQLGITPGPASAIVLAASGYFGRAPNYVWEWMQAKLAAPTNAAG